MKNIKIAHFDDKKSAIIRVRSHIRQLKRELKDTGNDINIEYTYFKDHNELIDKIDEGVQFGLIILDIYSKTEDTKEEYPVGKLVLDEINSKHFNIPTIIFTKGPLKDPDGFDLTNIHEKYNFILGEKIIKNNFSRLLNRIRSYFIEDEKLDDQFIFDQDNIFLRSEILAIKKSNLNSILYKIKSDLNYKGRFHLERMSSGFSGAMVFKLKYKTNNEDKTLKSSILKISRDKETLQQEHEKSKNYYHEFPPQFRIDIGKKYQNDEVLAFLIEEVCEGKTLFDKLIETSDKNKIEKIFEDMYLSYGLKEHYNKKRNGENKFTKIFNKFPEYRFSLVKQSANQLKPIINDYLNSNSSPYDINVIDTLVNKGEYKTIRRSNQDKPKPLVLCHGDFHSKNILIQDNKRVLLIDTGGLRYDYWCTDICRLIVHLFIVGLDYSSYEYYDINKIENNLEVAKKLIKMDKIDPDRENDGMIYAINWLLGNVEKIYDDLFTKWEFQLGLTKEFLQASYRKNSIPASKRVLALLAASHCFISASKNIKQ